MNHNQKKNIRIVVLAAIVIAAAVAVALVMIRNSPARRVQRQIDLGNRYLSELHYEEAIAAYEAALTIDPHNETAKEELIRAHTDWMDDLARQEQTEALLEVVERATHSDYVGPDGLEEIKNHAATLLLDMADRKLAEGDAEEALRLYQLAESITSDPDLLGRASAGIAAIEEMMREEQAAEAEEEEPEEAAEAEEPEEETAAQEETPQEEARTDTQEDAENAAEQEALNQEIEAEAAEFRRRLLANESIDPAVTAPTFSFGAYKWLQTRGWTVISHTESNDEGGVLNESGVCEKGGRRLSYQWRRVVNLYYHEEYQTMFMDFPPLQTTADVTLE